jgi:hypothetical protein
MVAANCECMHLMMAVRLKWRSTWLRLFIYKQVKMTEINTIESCMLTGDAAASDVTVAV